uniref:Uncharacterized protein n=1 Tax=Arundo donax TaxID=35708 RepID=A0A0A9E6Y4_ARUDO
MQLTILHHMKRNNFCTYSDASEAWPKPGGKLPVKEL